MGFDASTMFTRPRFEVIITLEERFGRILINPGTAGKGIDGKARILRMSYTFTNASGYGLD